MKTKQITIQKEVTPVIDTVNNMNIVSSVDMTSATSALSQLNKFLDGLTIEKEKLTKPINEALKEIRGRYKPTELILEEAIKTIKTKMGAYQTEQLAIQKKEENKIASKVADGKMKVETAVKKLSNMDTPDERVITNDGSVSFQLLKKFEVTDISKLPIAYHLPNEKAIKTAMSEGRELLGVKYWEEQGVINRRN